MIHMCSFLGGLWFIKGTLPAGVHAHGFEIINYSIFVLETS